MSRRALRPSFVVTFALGAVAVAGGCGNGSGGGSAQCPAEIPEQGAPCDLPSSVTCSYGMCLGSPDPGAVCQGGKWAPFFSSCNPPPPVVEAGPDVYVGHFGADATPDVSVDVVTDAASDSMSSGDSPPGDGGSE